MFELSVTTSRNESYPVVLDKNNIQQLSSRISYYLPDATELFILVDKTVADIYLKKIYQGIESKFSQIELLEVLSGEKSKSIRVFEEVVDFLAKRGMKRRSILVLIGGGMIMDLGGFIGATYMRGVPVVNNLPILVAQIDASIGGKVAINHSTGKNLIGSFYNPKLVLIDPSFLSTLGIKQIQEGLAEVIKTAVIGSAELFSLVENHGTGIFNGQQDTVERLILLTVETKISLLNPDPFEINLARSLNFGHTLAHPLETVNNYGKNLSHGEAVAVGMATATRYAVEKGLCDSGTGKRIIEALRGVGLPVSLHVDNFAQLKQALNTVRNIRNGALNLVVPVKIGEVHILKDVDLDDLLRFLRIEENESD